MADLFDILLAKNLAGGGGIQPQGEIEITENGEYDVASYATANVNVASYPINVTFMNGDEEWAKVGVDGEGKIAEPTSPPIPIGFNYFDGWYDEGTKITFPYSPIADKSLNATFGTMPAGAILYAPLSSNKATAETGQTITFDDSVYSFVNESGILCAKKDVLHSGDIQVPCNTTNSNYTVSLWIKADLTTYLNNGASKTFEFVNYVSCGSIYQYAVLGHTGFWSTPMSREYSFGGTTDYKWHNYTMVFNSNGDVNLYLDGLSLGSISVPVNNLTNLILFSSTGTRSSNIYVSSLRVYDRVLTNDEITLLASEFTPTDR